MENNSVSCKLKVPKDLSAKTPSYLVNFSNGKVNVNSSNKLEYKSLRPYEDKNTDHNKARRMLIAYNGRLNYQSELVDNNNYDRSKLRYFIGVRNKASGKMKIYDAIPFHLKPVMKTDFQSSDQDKNIRERLDDLTASFGSKEKKRSMTARQKYATVAPLDSALDDMSLDESVSDANHSISISGSTTTIEYIPPQNPDAKAVDEVYRINDIISTEDDRYLQNLAEQFLVDIPTCLAEWKRDSAYCEYVLNHFDTTLDDVKVKYLLYYNYLVTFSRLLATDIKKRDPIPDIPEPIKSNLLEFFTISSRNEYGKATRKFPPLMKDKVLAYMIVLALFIDDYSVNLADVQSDTKFSMQKVINIAQVLGCHIIRRKVNNSAINFADLKLPLFIKQKHHKKI